jgi:hypothetical protein
MKNGSCLRAMSRRSRRSPRALALEDLESRALLAGIQMTPQEQLLIELVNRARANPVAEAARFGIDLNDDVDEDSQITEDFKQPLSPNQMLITAARGHSQNMLDRDFFNHIDPLTGKGPSDRARDAGYPVGAGENIAWFGTNGGFDRTEEVYNRHKSLFLSSGHRVNMLSGGYREIGNGILYGFYESRFAIMVTENFGSRGGDAFITGIAYTDSVTRDRFYDVGEGIDGMTVAATRRSDGATFSTTTGPSGGYGLQVPPGAYDVRGSGSGVNGITVASVIVNGANEKVDFNKRDPGLGAIEGRVFVDTNRNRTRDANEAFLSGETVYIDDGENGRLDIHEAQAVTDTTGLFQFGNLRPGEYRVRIQLTDNRSPTLPADEFYTVQVRAGEKDSSLLFGLTPVNRPPTALPDTAETMAGVSASISVTKNDSDPEGQLVPSSVEVIQGPFYGTARIDSTTGTVVYNPNAGFVGRDAFAYTVKDVDGMRSEPARVDVLVRPGTGNAWQNPRERFDVSNDGVVSPIDALQVINDINRSGSRALLPPAPGKAPPPYVDVNGDGFLSAIDALQVINEIERRLAAAAVAGDSGRPVGAVMKEPSSPPLSTSAERGVVAAVEFDVWRESRRTIAIDEFFSVADWLDFEVPVASWKLTPR